MAKYGAPFKMKGSPMQRNFGTKLQVAKKLGGKLLSRAVPYVGAALMGADIGGLAHRMIRRGQSFGGALKGHFLDVEPTTKRTTKGVGIESKNWQKKLKNK